MKQKTGRTYIPALTGEYVSEEDLRSWGREFFLNAILHVAPAPLYLLRDEVLPRYDAAFNLEKSHGHIRPEVKQLASQALLDVVIVDGIDGLKAGPQYQAVRTSSLLLYEATEKLLAWSKRFNLTGTRLQIEEAADPKTLRLARMDSVWPLVAALETILMWHFSRAGVVQTPGGLPLWRPKSMRVPKQTEILPPIALKTIHYDPRASVPSELLNRLDPTGGPLMEPIEADTPGWYIEFEAEDHFQERISKDFKRWLEGYITERYKSAQAAGLLKAPGKRDLARFLWTAKYQVKGALASELAKQYGVTAGAVIGGINWVLDLIRLEPRAGGRGRRRVPRPIAEQSLPRAPRK